MSWKLCSAKSFQISGSNIWNFAIKFETTNVVRILNKDTKMLMYARFLFRSDWMPEMSPRIWLQFFFSFKLSRKFSHHASDVKNKANNAMKREPTPLMHSVMISPAGVWTLLPYIVDTRQKNWTSGMNINAPTDIWKRSARISTEKITIFWGSALRFLSLFFRSELLFLIVRDNFRRLGIIPVALNTRSPWIGPMFGSKWNTRRQSPMDWQTASTTHCKK